MKGKIEYSYKMEPGTICLILIALCGLGAATCGLIAVVVAADRNAR